MAKTDEIKFLDQHMEKVVFGACALILAYGVFQWVLSAPLRPEVPEVDGQVVPATELDQELLSWAQRVVERKPSKGREKPVPDYDGEIAKQRQPADAATIASWGDHRSVMIPPKQVKPAEGVRLAKVKDILETFAPVFTELKGVRELVDQEGGVDKLVFRGKAEFPRGELLKAWNKEFRGSAMDEVIAVAVAVEIERRVVLGDGQFGPVTTVTSVAIPPAEGQAATEPFVIPDYDGKNADEVRKAIDTFSAGPQKDVLRPKYWKVWSQTDSKWTTPWIKEPVVKKTPAPAGAGAGAARTPEPVVKVDDGTIELLFHDTDVIVQRKYSYRMRVVFVSPLYTHDDVVYKGTPKDALVKTIASDWSQWITGQAIPRTTQYFLTSAQAMGANKKLYCTIFTRSLGQVVAERFEAVPGRIIGGVISKKMKNPTTGEMVSKVVDFSTNATVVHADFDKKYTSKTGRTENTREMICLEGGELVSHILVKHMPAGDPRALAYEDLQALVDAQAPR